MVQLKCVLYHLQNIMSSGCGKVSWLEKHNVWKSEFRIKGVNRYYKKTVSVTISDSKKIEQRLLV